MIFATYETSLFIFLFILSSVMLFYHHKKSKQSRITQWKKSLDLEKHSLIFQQLYQKINGFSLSRKARSRKDSLEYIYGEIEFVPFIALLSLVNPDNKTVFYDLGSGVGKAVLACAMVYPVQKSVGIELLPELHDCACDQRMQLATMPLYAQSADRISFVLANFLEASLGEATLIFINASTLFGSTWKELCAIINCLPHTTTIITTSKPLISDIFFPTISTEIQMSWGIVKVYIHKYKTNATNPIENIE